MEVALAQLAENERTGLILDELLAFFAKIIFWHHGHTPQSMRDCRIPLNTGKGWDGIRLAGDFAVSVPDWARREFETKLDK